MTTDQPEPAQPSQDLQNQQAANQLDQYLRQNHLKLTPTITFPTYNKLPLELELALMIVNKHEPLMGVQVVYEQEDDSK